MMYRTGPFFFIFSLLFLLDPWVYAECYYLDKSIVLNYQPCNPAQVNGTACCDLSNSVCSTEGYCYGNARFLYRGGCTDQDWVSPHCAKGCLDSTWSLFRINPTDLNTNSVLVAKSSFSNILPCSSGVFTDYFCCSDVAGSTEATHSCCDNSFNFSPGNPYAPSSVVQDDTSTSTKSLSSSTSSFSSVQTSSTVIASRNTALSGTLAPSPRQSAHTNSTAVRVGVGVPLGLLLLLSLGFRFHRERQRRTMMESLKREYQIALSDMWQKQSHYGYPLVSNTAGPHELEYTHETVGELHS